MTLRKSQVAELLTLAAAYDQRTIGETDTVAWLAVLSDLDFDDARTALLNHYRTSTDRLMPAHIRRGVDEIRQARLDACPSIPEPPEILADHTRAWEDAKNAIVGEIMAGRDPAPAVAEIVARTVPELNGGRA